MMMHELRTKEDIKKYLDKIYGKKNKKTKKELVEFDGAEYYFASKLESERGIYLLELQKSGKIKKLEFQKTIYLLEFGCRKQIFDEKNGEKIKDTKINSASKYVVDFYYWDNQIRKYVLEDVKNQATVKNNPAYILKRKIIIQSLADRCIFREIIGDIRIDWSKKEDD